MEDLKIKNRLIAKLDEKQVKCPPMELGDAGNIPAFDLVEARTARQSKVAQWLEVPSSSITRAVDSLLSELHPKILRFRFWGKGSTPKFVSDEVWDSYDGAEAEAKRRQDFPHPEVRLALKLDGERFPGERKLGFLGASLVSDSEIVKYLSFTTEQRQASSDKYRIMTVLGVTSATLEIDRTVFDILGSDPLTIFFAQSYPIEREGQSYFNAGVEHLEAFGGAAILVNLPVGSLGVPSSNGFNVGEGYIPPRLGNLAISILADGSVYITRMIMRPSAWAPLENLPSDSRKSSSLDRILSHNQWLDGCRSWPNEALSPLSVYQPPKLGDLPPPTDVKADFCFLDLSCWEKLSTVLETEVRFFNNEKPKKPFEKAMLQITHELPRPFLLNYSGFNCVVF